jgi:dTDP-4-amino-4,6-dideoxy-D-glucose acyltransferase
VSSQAYKNLGSDVRIDPMVSIRYPELVSFGNHVAVDFAFCCTTALETGDYVHIAPHVSVIGGASALLKLGHFCNLAAGSRVICASDAFAGEGLIGVGPAIPKKYRDRVFNSPVILENFANVGSNVVLMPGVVLAEGTVIGAGSVVTQSTEPWTIYVGTPARPIKKRISEKMKLFAAEMGY